MTARAVASLLHRAWLLAATLAVIAGLLGMHVLTSGHASHALGAHGAAAHSGPAPEAPAGHAAVGHSAGEAGGLAGPAMDVPAPCGSACPLAQEPGAQCTPSAPAGPQTIHPPQATRAVLPTLRALSSPGSAYGYLPPGPTPCDLSISRT